MVLWIELLLGFFFELDFCLDLFCIELLLEPSFVHWTFGWTFFLALDFWLDFFLALDFWLDFFLALDFWLDFWLDFF